MVAYYNEIDPFAAEWLRNLIRDGHIAPGDVDERSIEDVTPSDLIGYEQCHFFAGIGIWSLVLRNAGWEDHRRIWTGSCPCQPFSTAGKGDGFDDERHLWPAWFHLIEECSPEVVMGEQVASKDGLAWLDLVSSDMEGTNHTFWATDTCAAGFGAPHIRQRLYWLANAKSGGQKRGPDRKEFRSNFGVITDPNCPQQNAGMGNTNGQVVRGRSAEGDRSQNEAGDRIQGDTVGSSGGLLLGLANADQSRLQRWSERRDGTSECPVGADGMAHKLGHANSNRRSESGGGLPSAGCDGSVGNSRLPSATPSTLPTNGFWGDCDWLYGTDGFFRPVEPGTTPLDDGHPNRMGLISAYGNAICAPQAQGFIESVMDDLPN